MVKRSRFPSISVFIVIAFLPISTIRSEEINGPESRKLDEVDQSKCGGCPCGTTCTPVYPSPPPPSLPPPPPPPPKTPKPSYGYCPPPPSAPSPPSNYVYMTGPPGNLYPIDQTYNGAGRRSFAAVVAAALGGSLVALFMIG